MMCIPQQILQYLGDHIKKNETGWACGTNGRRVYRILVGRPKGMSLLGRPWRKILKLPGSG